MKTIIAGLICMAIITVHAQQPSPAPGHLHVYRHHRHNMIAKLNLSDVQKQQLKSVNADYHNKLSDLKQQQDITVRESGSRLRVLRKEHRNQIAALLTSQQKDQLAKMKQERMQMAKINAMARSKKMKIKLGLNDAQASQLQTIRANMVVKIKNIRSDSTLNKQEKHKQIKGLVLQQKNAVKNILTPEQLQQLEQMKKERIQSRTGK